MADVMMAREASTRVVVVTVVLEGAEPGVGGVADLQGSGLIPRGAVVAREREAEDRKISCSSFSISFGPQDQARRDLSIAPFGLEFH